MKPPIKRDEPISEPPPARHRDPFPTSPMGIDVTGQWAETVRMDLYALKMWREQAGTAVANMLTRVEAIEDARRQEREDALKAQLATRVTLEEQARIATRDAEATRRATRSRRYETLAFMLLASFLTLAGPKLWGWWTGNKPDAPAAPHEDTNAVRR